ncbi:hypothetical protein IW262DRAFT_1459328 [Armillaria fumosa]|nr:hypothetical protein IW262DRAFT_1459328 [Armillaria fumosa]
MLPAAFILSLVWTTIGLDSPPGLDTPIAWQPRSRIQHMSTTMDPSRARQTTNNMLSRVLNAGAVECIRTILRLLGETRVPFGVRGGGHATNPGFSSTTGVQIATTRFISDTMHGRRKRYHHENAGDEHLCKYSALSSLVPPLLLLFECFHSFHRKLQNNITVFVDIVTSV